MINLDSKEIELKLTIFVRDIGRKLEILYRVRLIGEACDMKKKNIYIYTYKEIFNFTFIFAICINTVMSDR